MQEIEKIEQRIQKEVLLKAYRGADRVVYAEDKKREIDLERKNKPKFIAMTGLPDLDSCTEGFRKGQLIVVSGPPKNGKTLLAQTFTDSFAQKGYRCLWFSYELGYEELFDKFPMDKLDFFVPNYMESGNLDWVEQRIIEAKQKHNTDIVFIDHLDFLRDPEVLRAVSSHLPAYIGSIVQKLKTMAIQNNIIIFLLSHIRKNEWTTNNVPTSEELADSRQIAQLADMVLMIIRRRAERKLDEVYDGAWAILGVMENRHNGKTRKISLAMDGGKFVERFYTKIDEPVKDFEFYA